MKLSIVKLRAERNGLKELASDCFRDDQSELIRELNSEGKEAFLGIQMSSGRYTVIGRHHVYFLSASGERVQISNVELLKVLQKVTFKEGKGAEYEYLDLGNGENIWMKSGPIMYSLWNIVLSISRKEYLAEIDQDGDG